MISKNKEKNVIVKPESKKEKLTLLWITDDPWQKTGYGMVSRNVLGRLKDEFNVIAFGTQFRGSEINYEGYKVVPNGNKSGDGFDMVEFYIKKYNPDVVVTLKDVGLQLGYIAGINNARQSGWKGKWYGYCPIDTNHIVPEWIGIWQQMDGVIAMAEWGRIMIKQGTRDRIDPICIPHGVDTKVFHPKREEQKKKLEDDGAPFAGMFVVGAVGRNQYRKMWDKLFKGFAEFSKDKNDVVLLIHSDEKPVIVSDGWDFGYISRKYNMHTRWMLTHANMDVQTRFWIDDNQMNDIYNSFDVFCFPTGGEGFGIPLLEAQAAGVPVITTEFTTGLELVKGHGWLVEVLKDKHQRPVYWTGQNGVDFAIPDDVDVAKKLQEAYDNKKLLEEYRKKAREHSMKYDWDVIVPMWADLIRNRPTQKKS